MASDAETRTRIREYLLLEEGPERGTNLQAIEDIVKVGRYHDLDVWQARLVFADHEMSVWVIPEPVLNYYIHRGRVSDEQSEIGNPEEAATFHTGLMMVLGERQRQHRLDEFEPREAQAARGPGGKVIRAGKNTKVTVPSTRSGQRLAKRIMDRFLARGVVELETVGAGAVNQTVKAVARARQALAPDGVALVVIPELVQVPLGHGSQTVVHLTVVDMHGGY